MRDVLLGRGLVLGPNINWPMEAGRSSPRFGRDCRGQRLAPQASEQEQALIEALRPALLG